MGGSAAYAQSGAGMHHPAPNQDPANGNYRNWGLEGCRAGSLAPKKNLEADVGEALRSIQVHVILEKLSQAHMKALHMSLSLSGDFL